MAENTERGAESCRRFQLIRRDDETGVSGTGVVVEGVVFSDGHAAIHWTGSKWPTTTPHPGGIESVLDVHGHDGKTVLMWLDAYPAADYGSVWTELRGYVQRAADDGDQINPVDLLTYLVELRRRALAPVRDWMDKIGVDRG